MYDKTQNSIYDYTKPTQSFDEQRVSERLLANAHMDAEAVRPPIPNIGKTPPRFGYRTGQPGIYDILQVDEVYPARFGDWSGTVGGYSGTSYPSLNQM